MITILANVIMAIAIIVLAFLAYQSNKLAKEIKRTSDLKEKEDKEFKQQARVIAWKLIILNILLSPIYFWQLLCFVMDADMKYIFGIYPHLFTLFFVVIDFCLLLVAAYFLKLSKEGFLFKIILTIIGLIIISVILAMLAANFMYRYGGA